VTGRGSVQAELRDSRRRTYCGYRSSAIRPTGHRLLRPAWLRLAAVIGAQRRPTKPRRQFFQRQYALWRSLLGTSGPPLTAQLWWDDPDGQSARSKGL